jgi:hypothetical protein
LTHTTIILPVVLYGYVTLSLTLREEHRLRVFENRMLRRLYKPKWDQVTGGRRKLHNEERHSLYSLLNIIRMMKSRMVIGAGCVACMGEMKNAYRILVGKPEGKRQLRRPRHRWEYDIKMDLRDIVLDGMDCIHLAQDVDWWQALVKTVMNLTGKEFD